MGEEKEEHLGDVILSLHGGCPLKDIKLVKTSVLINIYYVDVSRVF